MLNLQRTGLQDVDTAASATASATRGAALTGIALRYKTASPHRATKSFARRSRRGFTLIETSLAIGITVVALNAGLQFWSHYVFRKSLDTEARQVIELAAAAKHHILFKLDQYISWTRLTPTKTFDLTIDDLTGTESYRLTAPRTTVRRRDLSVFLWSPTPTSLVIVTQAKFPDGVTGRLGAPRHTSTGTPIGWVPPYAPTRLEGAGLYYDITKLQNAGRVFKPGDFVSVEYISNKRNVLPYLHRISVPEKPKLNRMDTDLDMNHNSLLNVENITAEILAVTATLNAEKITGDLTVLGKVTIEGDIDIGETLDVSGGTVISNGMTAGNLTVAQTLTTKRVTATTVTTGGLTVDTLVAKDRITGTALNTNTLVANSLAVDHGTAKLIETDTLLVNGKTTAKDVVTTTLTTGSCTGC